MIILHLDDAVIKSLSGNELNILKFICGHAQDVLDISQACFLLHRNHTAAL